MTRPCILICEDETALREDIGAELTEAGYRVLSAADGSEALAALEVDRPDLILCDITMPRLDGREVLAHLRAERPDLAEVPFLFLTALGERCQVVAGKLSGADDYLVKPVDYDLMLATVAAHLRQVERVRASFATRLDETRAALQAPSGQDGAALDRLASGIVLLDESGAVIQANAAAREICGAGNTLSLGPQLSCAGTAGTALRAAIEQAVSGQHEDVEPVAVPRNDGGRDVILLVGGLAQAAGGAAALVLLVDPDRRHVPDCDLLARVFGLTPTEARIASLLAQGQRPDEIAVTLGVSGTTVAFHLKNIFSKTLTNRQSDLVALILSLPPLVPL